MGELGEAYRGVRLRMNDLVRDADPEALRTIAPATPAWTVHDLVAHVTGVVVDITEGRLEGVATDPWTARQVDARREQDTLDVLDEWNHYAPTIEDGMDQYGPAAFTLLADTVTHEHDVRGALGTPGARDSDAMQLWWNALTRSRPGPDDVTVPALELVVESGTVVIGDGPPVATLETTRFELLRAATGRRSLDQIRAYVRRGAFEPTVLVDDRFPARPDALVE
jgi:uncharacterized protein (TIGR03083 family)